MNTTKSKLILAFITLITLLSTTTSRAEIKTYIEYGRSIVNSHNAHGGIGFVSDITGWDIGVSLLGQGETQRGSQQPAYVYSISKIHPLGKIKVRLGVAKARDVELIGDINYKLGVIFLSNKHGEFELTHLSSGGIFDPNTGYDAIVFRLIF